VHPDYIRYCPLCNKRYHPLDEYQWQCSACEYGRDQTRFWIGVRNALAITGVAALIVWGVHRWLA
jgi:hypothetical protein